MQIPTSVLTGHACAICWRDIWGSTQYQQSLDGVNRNLCEGCATRMYPVLPKGYEGANLVHLDAKAMIAEIEAKGK